MYYERISTNELTSIETMLFGLNHQISQLDIFASMFFRKGKKVNEAIVRRLEISNNILLVGKPGVGKTRSVYNLVRKLKDQNVDVDLFLISVGTILNPELAVSSKNVEQLFSELRKDAINGNGVVIFFDEIDWIGMSRFNKNENDGVRRAMSSLFIELDKNINIPNFLFIGATNILKLLDAALLRRFTSIIQYPDKIERQHYENLVNYLFNMKFEQEDINNHFHNIKINKLTPSDIKNACRNAFLELHNNGINSNNIGKILNKYLKKQLSSIMHENATRNEYQEGD